MTELYAVLAGVGTLIIVAQLVGLEEGGDPVPAGGDRTTTPG